MECFLSVHHQRFKVTAVWNSAPVGPFPNGRCLNFPDAARSSRLPRQRCRRNGRDCLSVVQEFQPHGPERFLEGKGALSPIEPSLTGRLEL